MTERTTVRLPDELVRRAKRKAADEGRSLTALIEEGLRRVLNDHASANKAPRTFPRVSDAAGGLLPGIDLDNTASLQEIEDLERARRLR
jgi:predicted component of type VI protein secretion system